MRLLTPLFASLMLVVLTLPAHSQTKPVKGVVQGTANVVKGVGKGVVQVGTGVVKGAGTVVKGTVRGLGCVVTLGNRC